MIHSCGFLKIKQKDEHCSKKKNKPSFSHNILPNSEQLRIELFDILKSAMISQQTMFHSINLLESK